MARQKLGQHFLADRNVLYRIAEAACVPGEPVIVEIGPGKGALTEHLLRRAGHVAAIELDPELAVSLAVRFPSLEVVRGDA
ncbi:MAG: ribosomal RNA small subunit methyltransferase A, partial [Acidobacteriota bacterium]|nr:ribosomal RNA small subunit methyltransferase A [Acidobacteriota bacterium]